MRKFSCKESEGISSGNFMTLNSVALISKKDLCRCLDFPGKSSLIVKKRAYFVFKKKFHLMFSEFSYQQYNVEVFVHSLGQARKYNPILDVFMYTFHRA